MFLFSLVKELNTKEENDKTVCNFILDMSVQYNTIQYNKQK